MGEPSLNRELTAIVSLVLIPLKFTRYPSHARAAGDATFHSGVTLHRAPGNLTINEPENEFQRADLRSWYPGLKPGDAAASPIIWS